MNIWLIQIGEPLPLDGNFKKMRTAMLADKLVECGHKVLWWTSAFDHYSKSWIYNEDKKTNLKENLDLYAIKGSGYKKNISIGRFRDHRKIAKKFAKLAENEEKPDFILASMPTYDLTYKAVKFGKKYGIPVVVDIRDEWPDIFLEAVPKGLRWLARIMLSYEYHLFRYGLREANGILSMMNSILDWGLKHANKKKTKNDRVFYLGRYRHKYNNDLSPKLQFLSELKDKFIVIFIGTFTKIQNPSIIVDCAKKLEKENMHFVLAGEGEFYNECKLKAEGLKNVSLTGWLNDAEIISLCQHADLGLLPITIYTEVFNNKTFTYFASDAPIITSCQGELKDLLLEKELGLYYEPNDVDGLEKGILKFYEDKQLYERMKENVKVIFEEQFEAENIYTEFVKYIERIVNENKQNK